MADTRLRPTRAAAAAGERLSKLLEIHTAVPVRLVGFPYEAGERPWCLVLGSMPGRLSLAAREYYAHPRNQFWALLGELLGAGRDLPYSARLEVLKERGIVLWDVVHSCVREGSLDAAIRWVEANDFRTLFAKYPSLRRVVFNGAAAERLFLRHVLPQLTERCSALELYRLPSTSPAHAGTTYEEKRRAWATALRRREDDEL